MIWHKQLENKLIKKGEEFLALFLFNNYISSNKELFGSDQFKVYDDGEMVVVA